MTEILVVLLKELKSEEIKQGLYLALGRLRPLYESLEFNLAEKQLQKSLARAYKATDIQVKQLYKHFGDLGNVAQKLASKSGQKLSLLAAYKKLESIAADQGEGSQERKIQHLADLLSIVDPLSAKYISRIVLAACAWASPTKQF